MPNNNHSSPMDRRRRRGDGRDRNDRFDRSASGSRGRPNYTNTTDRRQSPRSRDRTQSSATSGGAGNHVGGARDRSPLGRGVKVETSPAGNAPEESTAPWNQALETSKKRFTGRCRLFVGNLPTDLKEEDLRDLFSKYGEINECYLSGKGFGFVRVDTRAHAEVAKEELDGYVVKGRPIRVRFAVHGAAVRVKGLSHLASNELLHQAFSMFGDVERAVHIVDERGRPTGEGIVEFERKPGAVEALRRINEGVFLLTANPRPIIVEPLEPKDDDDGLVERMITKNPQYHHERMQPPRFAVPGNFDFDFGNRWKELYHLERAKREQLDQELKEARERLENEMELAHQEYQAQMLREDLKRRQEELERLEAARRERMELLRRQGEDRMRNIIAAPQSQASMVSGMFPGGFPPMAGMMGQNQHQQQQQQFQGQRGHRENVAYSRPLLPREDAKLVHGVQQLLQMLHNDPSAAVPSAMAPHGIGLLGHQPADAFFGGPDNSRHQQQTRERDGGRGGYESSRRRHH